MTMNATESSDLIELRRLVDAYALAMDTRDVDAFPRLFVPDGSLIVRGLQREKPLGVFRGPGVDGVALIARLLGELYPATLHNITTHEAFVDGDAATGTTYCLAYHVIVDGAELETLGVRYADRFVHTPDGWRFHTRDATRLWSQTTPTPAHPLRIDRGAAAAR